MSVKIVLLLILPSGHTLPGKDSNLQVERTHTPPPCLPAVTPTTTYIQLNGSNYGRMTSRHVSRRLRAESNSSRTKIIIAPTLDAKITQLAYGCKRSPPMSLPSYLSIHLGTFLPIYPSRYLPTYLSIYIFIYLPTYLSIYIFIHLSTYLSLYVPFYICIFLPIYLCTFLPTYLCTFLPTYLCTFLPAYLCTFLPSSLCTFLTIYVPSYQSMYLLTYPSIYLPTYPSIYLPTYLDWKRHSCNCRLMAGNATWGFSILYLLKFCRNKLDLKVGRMGSIILLLMFGFSMQ